MKDIRLDIGCGGRGTMYPDFIGVDIHPAPTDPRKPGAEYLQLDFVYSAALPWKPGTVAELVAFHIIEHLEYQEGQTLLRRAWDLLRPGAKMFITCPGLDFFIQSGILNCKTPFLLKKYSEFSGSFSKDLRKILSIR